jgi:hypothetical protein
MKYQVLCFWKIKIFLNMIVLLVLIKLKDIMLKNNTKVLFNKFILRCLKKNYKYNNNKLNNDFLFFVFFFSIIL